MSGLHKDIVELKENLNLRRIQQTFRLFEGIEIRKCQEQHMSAEDMIIVVIN